MKQNFRLVELNNKSRQGLYIYVKTGKKRGSYYKYDYETPIDAYLEYDKRKHDKRTKKKYSLRTTKKTYRQTLKGEKSKNKKLQERTKRQIRKITKRPKIQTLIKKGIQSTTIKNSYTANRNNIKEAIKKILQPLVIDKQFLEILSLPHNVEQFKSRLEHRITTTGTNNERLNTGNTTNKSTYTVIQELQKNTKKGEEILNDNSYTEQQTPFYMKMKNLKYNMNPEKEGRIKNISVTIILRKG